MLWLWMLACGESATFEEEPAVEEVEEVAAVEKDDYEPVTVPIDGVEPTEVEVEAEAQAPRGPQPGQPWPPIVVPQDAREREWKWDFKSGGTIKKDREKEMTVEEANEMELESERTGEVF